MVAESEMFLSRWLDQFTDDCITSPGPHGTPGCHVFALNTTPVTIPAPRGTL